jgi:hypothetical protein
MADVNTEGYLVQLQDENGTPLFPIISADLIKDSEGNTFDLPGLKSSVEQAEQDVATLQTSVDECFQSVSDGKTLIANAITGKGVTTSSSATFATMASNISRIASYGLPTINSTNYTNVTPTATGTVKTFSDCTSFIAFIPRKNNDTYSIQHYTYLYLEKIKTFYVIRSYKHSVGLNAEFSITPYTNGSVQLNLSIYNVWNFDVSSRTLTCATHYYDEPITYLYA